ncbi:MAG TPA: phosphoribosylformylglycinamidine synthase subunit PurS [Actinomycetota bacterium]|nr:phosphoribosylformylglycinamidine synthase subunit PurS [Actinomycetota bacterium]
MSRFIAKVDVMPRQGISDPQGQTIERALPALGLEGISSVRVGKSISFQIDASDEDEARRRAGEVCDRLLANPVLESFNLVVLPP